MNSVGDGQMTDVMEEEALMGRGGKIIHKWIGGSG
jgi:hypothetical protein